MAKNDFNKVTKQLYWNRTSAWVFACKFAAYFQNTFFTEQLWGTTSEDRVLSLTLLKRDSGTVAFLWILQKNLSWKNSIVDVLLGSKYALASVRYLQEKKLKKIQKVINFKVETSGKKFVIVFRGAFKTLSNNKNEDFLR